MKKYFIFLLIFAILMTFCSCGKPSGTSDAMYQIGLNALKWTDKYINGEITGDEAYERIKEFNEQAHAEYEKTKSDELKNNWYIYSDIGLLSHEILFSKNSNHAMSDVQESRNNLAKDLGK